jgi:hypothetical protein
MLDLEHPSATAALVNLPISSNAFLAKRLNIAVSFTPMVAAATDKQQFKWGSTCKQSRRKLSVGALNSQ